MSDTDLLRFARFLQFSGEGSLRDCTTLLELCETVEKLRVPVVQPLTFLLLLIIVIAVWRQAVCIADRYVRRQMLSKLRIHLQTLKVCHRRLILSLDRLRLNLLAL